jgi:hypothetical protein
MDPKATLDFAYKYPFSKEAKEVVHNQADAISMKYLEMGGKHLENATSNSLDYTDISIGSVKLDYVMTYLYSRMLLSAIKRPDLIKLYAIAEAKRASNALINSQNEEIIDIATQLGLKITGTFGRRKDKDGVEELSIGFIDYIKNAPKQPNFELVNQKLSGGIVVLNRNNMIKIIEQAMVKEITKGLPIKSTELPKQVLDYSKGLKFKTTVKTELIKPGKKTEEWIEKLLQTPIADVRHRTVNLILAPYLVNSKGYEVDQASKIIIDYIERCKQIDPNTRVNEGYIRYQCTYAKRRGLKPLSIDRAKELLGNQIDL